MTSLRSFSVACVLSLCAVAAQGSSVMFSVTDISAGKNGTVPTGINSSGQIVGYYSSPAPHPFLYDGNVTPAFKDIAPPNSNPNISQAYAINDSGLVVGSFSGAHVFTYAAGTATFGTPGFGGANATVSGVNSNGIFVGQTSFTGAPNVAYEYTGGAAQKLALTAPLGETLGNSEGKGINSAGDVVGWAKLNGVDTAFVLSHTGTLTYLSTPAGHPNLTSSRALAISNDGVVTGYFTDSVTAKGWAFQYKMGDASAVLLEDGSTIPSLAKAANSAGKIVGSYTVNGAQHGFIYVPGEGVLDLNNEWAPGYAIPAGLVVTDAVAINDSNTIAGVASLNGKSFAVRLNFVPLPSSGLLGLGLMAAVGGIGLIRRLRRAD